MKGANVMNEISAADEFRFDIQGRDGERASPYKLFERGILRVANFEPEVRVRQHCE